jgi:hypothetical protein
LIEGLVEADLSAAALTATLIAADGHQQDRRGGVACGV